MRLEIVCFQPALEHAGTGAHTWCNAALAPSNMSEFTTQEEKVGTANQRGKRRRCWELPLWQWSGMVSWWGSAPASHGSGRTRMDTLHTRTPVSPRQGTDHFLHHCFKTSQLKWLLCSLKEEEEEEEKGTAFEGEK